MTASFRQKVQSGLFWSLVQNWGLRFGGLLVFMVLARILTPSEMGVFAAATTVVAFCALFVESGLSEAVVQQAEVTPQQLNSIFYINLAMAVIAVVGLWLAAPWIADYMKLTELTSILRISSLGIVISAACFSQTAMYRRKFEYRILAMASLSATAASGLLAVVLALTGWGAWSLVAQALTSSAVTALLLWRSPQWALSSDFDFSGTRRLLSYGTQRLLTTLMDFANTRFIELFFASVLGASALGLYVVGTRIYQALMQTLCSAILDIAHNAFSRLAHDKAALRDAYYTSMSISAAIAVPIFCISAAVSDELTYVVFGSKWRGVSDVLQPLLLLGAVQVLQYYNGIVYNAMGRPSIGLVLVTIKAVVTLGALYAAKEQSFNTIIFVFVYSQLIITPLSFYVAKRIIGISVKSIAMHTWPFIMASSTSMLAVFFARTALPHETPKIVQLALLLLIGLSTYIATTAILARDRALAIVVALKKSRANT